jgi:hypothetical protein
MCNNQKTNQISNDFDLEIVQTRRNEKLMKLLDTRRKQAQTIPLDEVKRRLGIKQMRGLLKTDKPAPTDEEITAMLEERRQEKHDL